MPDKGKALTLVHAYDEQRRIFRIPVYAFVDEGQEVISLGGKMIQFRREDFRRWIWGDQPRLCIDMDGKLHAGSRVWLDRAEGKKAYDAATRFWNNR